MGTKKKLTLRDFIDTVGPDKIAASLNVSKQNVSLWYNFKSAPRPHTAAQLIELSHGLISWESIYQPYVDMTKEAG